MKIAVVGASGRVGRHVVDVLTERGYEVVPISRSHGVDVITGDGLAEALTGVEAIVDAATGPSPDEQTATAFFTTSTQNLQEFGQHAGVQRIVVVSIIGIDRLAGGSYGGYYQAKIAHEKAMLAGPIPVHILRATQFHEFVAQLIDWGTQGEVSYLPKMRTQLVAARTVAEALADLATSPWPEATSISEIGGPREENLIEVAALYVSRRDIPLKIEGVTNPDDPGAVLMENGALLPGPNAVLAGPTFEEWLESTS